MRFVIKRIPIRLIGRVITEIFGVVDKISEMVESSNDMVLAEISL